ncbi:hypothetical protein GCM10011579_053140 [Streptomyces albiflavescens]|uniref:Uncharacterized protein n=1 Tax=Streptomyces albiflavescens TaxID=1623582 RepID=A0A917Y9M3_9ACTN|nr:hypothetical protein GCM10011579_053140 [Streptomyces albiflavescens]
MRPYVPPVAALGPYGCRVAVGPYGCRVAVGPYARPYAPLANLSLTAVETPERD